MNRAAFFAQVTPDLFFGSLPDWQREPLDRHLDEAERRKALLCQVAYVLATAYHETGRWKHTEEIGRGRGRDYGRPIMLIRNRFETYYGRGDCQLTWIGNYARLSAFLSAEHGRPIDLVNAPELAKEPEIAAQVIWEGMMRGMFTGLALTKYVSAERVDYINARRVVNGTDKAASIAGYAQTFEAALRAGGYE